MLPMYVVTSLVAPFCECELELEPEPELGLELEFEELDELELELEVEDELELDEEEEYVDWRVKSFTFGAAFSARAALPMYRISFFFFLFSSLVSFSCLL